MATISLCNSRKYTGNWRQAVSTLLALLALLAPLSAAAQANVGMGISGTAWFNGEGFSGVTITVSGDADTTTTTGDRDGSYLVALPPGQYVVTAAKDGYLFEPSQQTVQVVDTVVHNVDFTAQVDGCPADPNKSASGVCGCGVPDTDADDDGIIDCMYDDTPLACGEEPTVVIEERLVTDNEALGALTLAKVQRLKKLIGAVAKRYGGKEGARLRHFAKSYEQAVAKVAARTHALVEELPSILVPCPGHGGSVEVSNIAAKNEMRSNTDALRKMSMKVLTRLVFYQTVRYPLDPPSAKKIAKIQAERQATKADIAELYTHIVTLIDKVPDVTLVSEP